MKAWVYHTRSVYRRTILPVWLARGFKHLDRALHVLQTGTGTPTSDEECAPLFYDALRGLGHWAAPGETFALIGSQCEVAGSGVRRLVAGIYTDADVEFLVQTNGHNGPSWGQLVRLDYDDIYLPEEDFVTKVSLLQTLRRVADL